MVQIPSQLYKGQLAVLSLSPSLSMTYISRVHKMNNPLTSEVLRVILHDIQHLKILPCKLNESLLICCSFQYHYKHSIVTQLYKQGKVNGSVKIIRLIAGVQKTSSKFVFKRRAASHYLKWLQINV